MVKKSLESDDPGLPSKPGEDMSYLIKHKRQSPSRTLIAIVEIDPADSAQLKLGVYERERPPGGFMLEYEPRIDPGTEVKSKITATRSNNDMYELMLYIENSSAWVITAKVWEL